MPALYRTDALADVPLAYRPYCMIGSGRAKGLFTVAGEIRKRCRFLQGDLRGVREKLKSIGFDDFDAILCRNVLIYFDEQGVDAIVRQLRSCMRPRGVLCIGHSEAIDAKKHGLEARGRAMYRAQAATVGDTTKVGTQMRALVVDDSLVVRRVLRALLSRYGFVVEAVDSAVAASAALSRSSVDLVTLDLRMPGTDGATWLRDQRRNGLKTPVAIVSESTPTEAADVFGVLTTGAQDFVTKSELNEAADAVGNRLRAIARHAADWHGHTAAGKNAANIPHGVPKKMQGRRFRPEAIVIGASTGGTEALVKLLQSLPPETPPVIVVQHITTVFARTFAERLASAACLNLAEVRDGMELKSGHLYMALGDYHIGVRRKQGILRLIISNSAPEWSMRPAVDVLFRSAAAAKLRGLAAILTGMGRDGAHGMLELKEAGCLTLAQDEASSVVFGMSREAIALGGAQVVGNLEDLRREIDRCLEAAPPTAA